ncbi:MAG: hypothetical protein M3072_08385 [Candidatus Dormibacteraeota bacterium]|nr:hypothetical protein [Candidatus Dormibacteraeota bacterium]
MIDASSAEFAGADRFREEAARKSQREAVDQEAREVEAAEAAHAVQPVVTAEVPAFGALGERSGESEVHPLQRDGRPGTGSGRGAASW